MSRRNFRELRVLCTGASSGIGAALSRQLAARGARLVLNARREEQLRELARDIEEKGGEVCLVPGDITEQQTKQAMLAQSQSQWGGVDAIINCAGIGSIANFTDSTEDVLRQIMEVNFFAAVELTRLAIPVLQTGRQPIIVNIGSVLGHRAVPKKSEYCASKFALHGFSDALRAELMGHMEAQAKLGARIFGQCTPRDFNLNMRLSEGSILAGSLPGAHALLHEG